MGKKVDIDGVLMEIYRELYKVSTPPADFDNLLENATRDDEGKLHIPFLDYEIEEKVMDNIIESVCKKHKIGFKTTLFKSIKTTIYLGCSPTTKREIDEN
jgi:hypothetical protein